MLLLTKRIVLKTNEENLILKNSSSALLFFYVIKEVAHLIFFIIMQENKEKDEMKMKSKNWRLIILATLSIIFFINLIVTAIIDTRWAYALQACIMISYFGWILYFLFGRLLSFSKLENLLEKKTKERRGQGDAGVYLIALPFIVLGIIVIVSTIIVHLYINVF